MLIRPSAEQLRLSTRQYFAASGIVLAVALINIYVLAREPQLPKALPGVLVMIGGFVLVGAILRALYLRNVYVRIGGSGLVYRNRFGVSRNFPRDQVGGIATRVVRFPNARIPQELYIFYGKDGTGLFSLSAPFWKPADIELARRTIGGRSSSQPKGVKSSELSKEFPHALTFVQRNNSLFGMLLVVLILVAAVLLTNATH